MTMRTTKELSGTSKTAQNRPTRQKGETQVVLDSSHVRVSYGTNQRQRLQKSRQERQKWLKRAKTKREKSG